MTHRGSTAVSEVNLDAAGTHALATRFAPLLFFHEAERHFPGHPDAFRAAARFRWSNRAGDDDAGWHRLRGGWEYANKHDAAYFDIPWTTITTQTAHAAQPVRPGAPTWDADVTRPRDERNVWRRRGHDGGRGLFLELAEGRSRKRSGSPNTRMPVFYDAYCINDPKPVVLALAYWVFYEYNWHVAMAHEGDWEHLTLYFPLREHGFADTPYEIFYAQHNEGVKLPWSAVPKEGTHPHAYVVIWGHPMQPTVPGKWRREWVHAWRTWTECELRALPAEEWARYDGAWGEVGAWGHSTGPLGPYFKRRDDRVRATEG